MRPGTEDIVSHQWSEPGYILTVNPTRISDGSNVGCGRKRENKQFPTDSLLIMNLGTIS